MLVATLTALVAGSAAAWNTQQEEQAGRMARAAVSLETAQEAALAGFPGARIEGSELIEEEGGRLIYSLELEVPGRGGAVDVQVDAMTGELLPAELADEEDGPGGDAPDD